MAQNSSMVPIKDLFGGDAVWKLARLYNFPTTSDLVWYCIEQEFGDELSELCEYYRAIGGRKNEVNDVIAKRQTRRRKKNKTA